MICLAVELNALTSSVPDHTSNRPVLVRAGSKMSIRCLFAAPSCLSGQQAWGYYALP